MSKEERLLRAIFEESKNTDGFVEIVFEDDDSDDDSPETHADKAGYAEFILQESLEYMSPALRRLSRINRLFAVTRQEDGGNGTHLGRLAGASVAETIIANPR